VAASPPTTLREAGSSKPTRRIPGRRLSATHVLIALVVILAFVFNFLVLADRSSTTMVAIADRPLVPGSNFDLDSVRLSPVDSDFEALGSLVTEAELAGLEGWVVVRPVPEGSTVDRTALVEPGSAGGLRSMSLAVPIEHAAGGTLTPGDRVDVISVEDEVAHFVSVDLPVISVSESTGSIGATGSYYLVVAVEPADALELAEAVASGSVEVVRSTGASELGVVDGG
jgi:Flp pilus assembly protein CpaB